MPGARYSLGSFPEGAASPFGAYADGETEGVALIFVSLFPPTAVLFLRPVSCSFLSEITKLSLRRKRGGGDRKIPPFFRGGERQTKSKTAPFLHGKEGEPA